MKKEFTSKQGLFGLVLAGGQSSRMGHPKELIEWHGKMQQLFMAELMDPICEKVFISCRKEQVSKLDSSFPFLHDLEENKGPLMAIHSAFHFAPNVAWLILPCDLPYFDENALDYLIENRNRNKMATCYSSPEDGKPEPLCAIWEPEMADLVSDAIKQEKRSPRKLLELADIHLITSKNPKVLVNVNTPEDAIEVHETLKSNLL